MKNIEYLNFLTWKHAIPIAEKLVVNIDPIMAAEYSYS